MWKLKYFRDEEVKGLNEKLILMLDRAREYAGVPFVINSGYRSPEHNREIGGAEDSAHTKGLAVDINCDNNTERFRMLPALLVIGFKRIEICDRHIHVDIDKTKQQEIIWLGISK